MIEDLLSRAGFSNDKIKESINNKKLSKRFEAFCTRFIDEITGLDRHQIVLLYNLSSTLIVTVDIDTFLLVARYIIDKQIRNDVQLHYAVGYLKKNGNVENVQEFEKNIGIGIDVKETEIDDAVNEVMYKNREVVEEGEMSISSFIKQVKETGNMKWADGALIKQKTDIAFNKAVRKNADGVNRRKKKSASVEHTRSHKDIEHERVFEGSVLRLHKPEENIQLKPELLELHLKTTGKKTITRFPPEPNGFLHIGHVKSMNFNFNYARNNGGFVYLRYDDTNPEGEKQVYYDSILETLRWLGYKPDSITCASDYFDKLYDFAVILIKKGFAYVCHQTKEEIQISRGLGKSTYRTESPWRDRPVSESLELFEKMKSGKLEPGEATLRLKMDIQNPNPFMWDPIAYKIKKIEHVKTGKKWVIYPSYDFSHCICDSLENITHSFCTTEFTLAREAYYWILDRLEIYRPVQWEFSRLNIKNALISKRKILSLIEKGVVGGWDDPRLFTVMGLKRRGYTPDSLNRFAERAGITSNNASQIDPQLLAAILRDELNLVCKRRMVVLDPLKVVIVDIDPNHVEMVSISANMVTRDSETAPPPNGGKNDMYEIIPFTNTVYIDKSDFSMIDSPSFYRLSPSRPVGLYGSCVIRFKGVLERDEHGEITVIEAERIYDEKPKAYIQWVSVWRDSPIESEVRLYGDLFLDSEDGGEPYLNPNSLVIKKALCDIRLRDAKKGERFQFQRLGYFIVDEDSTQDKMVLNRIIPLREDSHKDVLS